MRWLAPLLLILCSGCLRHLTATGPLPVPHDDDRVVTWAPMLGQLFVDGISVNDVRQGDLGDCFFVASLAALAWAQPERIARAITPRPDGLFDVALFSKGRRVTVTVDTVFPRRSGAPAYVSPTSPGELWGMVLEKAYARWRGNYRALDRGYAPDRVLRVVSGLPTERWTTEGDARALFDRLSRALAARSAIVATTKRGQVQAGLSVHHAYTVLSAGLRDGQGFVVLRNPHGRREPLGSGSDDGRLTLRLEEFQRNMGWLSVLPLHGAVLDDWAHARLDWEDADEEWDAAVAAQQR